MTTRRITVLPQPQPLLSPDDAAAALIEMMPLLDWLSQADALHSLGADREAANAMTDVLLAYRALPRSSPTLEAFGIWQRRNAFCVEALPRAPQLTIEAEITP